MEQAINIKTKSIVSTIEQTLSSDEVFKKAREEYPEATELRISSGILVIKSKDGVDLNKLISKL